MLRLKTIFLLFSTCIIVLLTGDLYPQSIYTTYDGFTVPTQAYLPATETHPSLWFNAGQIPALKDKKNLDTYAAGVWDKVRSLVTTYKSQTPSATGFNDRPRMAKALAFDWILNADTVSRRKAIECLMIAYGNVPRTANASDFDGDYDEIYRATWLQNYCAAYDWVKAVLTVQQDTTIRNLLIAETLLLRNNMVSGVRYAPRPHNHRSKPAWSIITAALTLNSDSRAADWLTFGLTQANTVTKYQFSADGIYREGSHYMIYGLVNCLPYLWHYKNVSGQDHFPYYQTTFEMPIRLRNSKGWLPNIEDSYIKPMPTHMAAAAYTSTATILHSTASLAKVMQWNWFNTTFPTTSYTGATNDVVWEIDEYITYDPTIPKVEPDAPAMQKTQSGVVVFRDTELLSAVPQRFLLFHGVAECDNHQHPDLLSYILDYKNTPLAVDPGYGKDGYGDSKRSWYIAPSSHNIVTIDSKAPLDWSDNVKPTDMHYLNAPGFGFAEKLAKTQLTNGKLYRGVAFVDKQFWVVYDFGSGASAVDYALNVHARGTISNNGKKYTWLTADDTYGTKQKLHVFPLSSSPATITVKTGYTSLWKDEAPQSFIEMKQNTASAAFLHLLFPGGATSTFPNVTDRSAAGVLAFKLQDEKEHLFVAKSAAGPVTIDSCATNANFTRISTINEQVTDFALVNGTSLIRNGSSLLTSQSLVSVACHRTGPGLTDYLQFDTLTENVSVSYTPSFPLGDVLYVLRNKVGINFSVTGNAVTFTLPAGTADVVVGRLTSGTSDESELMPKQGLQIIGGYPNPFNAGTRVRFYSAGGGPINISVRDVLGRERRSETLHAPNRGVNEYSWDGKDFSGKDLPSGMYFIQIAANHHTAVHKCLMVK